MKRLFIIVVLLSSACAPKLRIKPGELPPPTTPDVELKGQAEYYVQAHIEQSNFREISSGNDVARTKKVVARLAKAAGYSPETFPVHVVDAGDQVNAAAFNGASIVVYKELLKRVPNDEELATVLSHEVGHILGQHHKDSIEEASRAETVSIGSSILGTAASIGMSLAGYGGASDLVGDVTEGATSAIGYGVYVGRFSRVQEYEADHMGLIIMAKAGYDPRNAINFWSKADEIFGSSSSQLGSFFSTHPAESDRLRALEEAMPYALQYYNPKKR